MSLTPIQKLVKGKSLEEVWNLIKRKDNDYRVEVLKEFRKSLAFDMGATKSMQKLEEMMVEMKTLRKRIHRIGGLFIETRSEQRKRLRNAKKQNESNKKEQVQKR